MKLELMGDRELLPSTAYCIKQRQRL